MRRFTECPLSDVAGGVRLALALVAWKLGSWMLGALALFALLGLPFSNLNADAACALKEAGILPDFTEVGNAPLAFIERAMPLLEFNTQGRPRRPKEIAVMIQQVVPRLVAKPPGAAATTLLVGAYLAAFVVALAALVLSAASPGA